MRAERVAAIGYSPRPLAQAIMAERKNRAQQRRGLFDHAEEAGAAFHFSHR